MKKSILYGLLAVAGLSLTACDDFLDDNRYPETLEIDNPKYWSNPDNCNMQLNKMYNWISGYGNGASQGWYYFKTLNDDQVGTSFANWTFRNVPASSPEYNNPYTYIRACNYVIERTATASPALSTSDLTNFQAIARLNRAYWFYDLVRKYGDVQWIDEVVEPTDGDILISPRDDRDEVMDKVLADLDFAIENISARQGKQIWSKDLALAMKSEICLFEGTYCKYRTEAENGKKADLTRANKFLQESAKASAELINSGRYSINTKTATGTYNGYPYNIGAYQFNYNQNMTNAIANPEMIFVKAYNDGVFMNSIVNFTCSSTALSGISKDAFESYLFKDGKPMSLQADKADIGEVDANGNYNIKKILDLRDARLKQTIDTVVFYADMTWSRAGGLAMTSRSGYGICKYDNTSMPIANRVNANTNIVCAPIYWISYIYCNYAEAKAELGDITDEDLNLSINKLFARAELPAQTVEGMSTMNDPANNMGVSSLIWEIRRCRRCELIMDNWIRYWDLIRWHQLDKLDNTKYPNILLGANMTKAPVSITNVNGYVQAYPNERVYDPKYYFYPIPSTQLTLNEKLTQNPGWK